MIEAFPASTNVNKTDMILHEGAAKAHYLLRKCLGTGNDALLTQSIVTEIQRLEFGL